MNAIIPGSRKVACATTRVADVTTTAHILTATTVGAMVGKIRAVVPVNTVIVATK